MMNTVIPDALRYSKGLKSLGTNSKINIRKYFPEVAQSGYNTTNRVIRIPISAPTGFMDTNRSALNFRLTASATGNADTPANVYLANSAYSMIDTLRVLDSNGTVLEEIQNYGIIMNRLMDANLEYDHRTKEGTYAGFSGSTGNINPFETSNTVKLGSYTNASPTVYSADNAAAQYYSIPLVGSGILNMTSEAHAGGMFLPLALIQGLVVELQLVSNAYEVLNVSAVSTATPPVMPTLNFSVDQISYDATIIEFDSSLIASMKQQVMAAGGSVFLSSYTYHGQTISSSSSGNSLQMNERAKSIKSIFVIPRLQTQGLPANGNLSTAASPAPTNNGSINAYLLLGSQQYPNQPYNFYHELYKGFKDACGGGLNGIIDRASYESTTLTIAAANQGRFSVGFDLESVHARDLVEMGYNNATSSIPISVNITYETGTVGRNFTLASMVDMIVQVDIINRTVRTSY
jgi:hypothetical protein